MCTAMHLDYEFAPQDHCKTVDQVSLFVSRLASCISMQVCESSGVCVHCFVGGWIVLPSHPFNPIQGRRGANARRPWGRRGGLPRDRCGAAAGQPQGRRGPAVGSPRGPYCGAAVGSPPRGHRRAAVGPPGPPQGRHWAAAGPPRCGHGIVAGPRGGRGWGAGV